VRGAAPHETLQEEYPPIAYYSSHCEGLGRQEPPRRLNSGRAGQEAGTALAVETPALAAA
jgi:hypothetical protein